MTLETKMKIKLEVELDTEDQKDRIMIEKVLYQIEQIKQILENLDTNLNKHTNTKKKVQQ